MPINIPALAIHILILAAVINAWQTMSPTSKDIAFYLVYAILLIQGNWLMWRIGRLESRLKEREDSANEC